MDRSKRVDECVNSITRIQQSLWQSGDLEFLERADAEQETEIPVYWGMSPSSPPPPFWLNELTLVRIERNLSVTTLTWGVRMAFCPFLVHNYDNEAIKRAAVTAENISLAFDANVYLDGWASWTTLDSSSNLITIDERKQINQFIVRLHFGLRFGIQMQRPVPYC